MFVRPRRNLSQNPTSLASRIFFRAPEDPTCRSGIRRSEAANSSAGHVSGHQNIQAHLIAQGSVFPENDYDAHRSEDSTHRRAGEVSATSGTESQAQWKHAHRHRHDPQGRDARSWTESKTSGKQLSSRQRHAGDAPEVRDKRRRRAGRTGSCLETEMNDARREPETCESGGGEVSGAGKGGVGAARTNRALSPTPGSARPVSSGVRLNNPLTSTSTSPRCTVPHPGHGAPMAHPRVLRGMRIGAIRCGELRRGPAQGEPGEPEGERGSHASGCRFASMPPTCIVRDHLINAFR